MKQILEFWEEENINDDLNNGPDLAWKNKSCITQTYAWSRSNKRTKTEKRKVLISHELFYRTKLKSVRTETKEKNFWDERK